MLVRYHMKTAAVRAAAESIRSAIQALPACSLPITFSSFPRGACGDTCLILGTYLEEECGLGKFDCVSASRGSHSDDTWTSHAWLQHGNLYVDITADQFKDAPGAVLVEVDSEWHRTFDVDRRGPSNIKSWHEPGTHHVLAVYVQVKRYLANH
jgi:hypothetical protein